MTGCQQGGLPGRGNSELSCGLASWTEARVWDKGDRAWYRSSGDTVAQMGQVV